MNTTVYKKELLYRKANGKRLIKDYISKVNSLFLIKEKIILMNLEETDKILFSSNEINKKIIKIKILAHELYRFIQDLKYDDSPYYVFIDEDWKYCGSFIIPSISLLNENFMFGKEILNDILFISTDLKNSISFDYYEVNNKYFIDIVKSTSLPINLR